MATYNIAATADDGFSVNTDETADPGTTYAYIGSNNDDRDWGLIYRATGIPQGATILTATLFLTRHVIDTGGTTVVGDWWGFDVDSPAAFADAHTHRISDHETRTTASVAESITVTETTHTSPSLSGIIQELVDRAGFSGDIGLTFRNTSVGVNFWPLADFSTTSGVEPALTITVAATAAVTGTATASITEADIVAGGKTIIITLGGETWIPSS